MKIRILLVMVCVGMLGGAAGAASPLAERIPAGALAYAGWAGSQDAEFQKATFAAFLKEPVCGRILEAIKTITSNEMYGEEEKKVFAAAWPLGIIALRRPTTVAWMGLDKMGRYPMPRMVALVDLGKEKKAFGEHVDALLNLIPPEARKELKDATLGGVTYKTAQLEHGPEMSFGYMGDVFFLTIGKGMAGEVITLKPAASLQADEAFVARMKEVGAKHEQLSFYFDVMSTRKALKKMELGQGEWAQTRPSRRGDDDLSVDEMLRLLGMAKVSAVAAATTVAPDSQMISRTKIFSPAPHKGAMMVFGGKPLTDADLAHVPADADMVFAYNISASRGWKELRKIIRGFDPRADEQMHEGLGQIGGMFGVSLEDDILDNLGDTWVVSSAVSQGGAPTGTVLTVELKDPDAFVRTIVKIELAARVKNMLGQGEVRNNDEFDGPRPDRMDIEKLKAGDTEIHYLVSSGRGFMPITPAWAVHNKKLYVAMFPQVIKSAIEHEGRNPLIASPKYTALRTKTNTNALGLAYINTPQMLGRHYATLLIYSNVLTQMGLYGRSNKQPVRPDFVPAMSTILKYIPPTIETITADKTGVIFEQHGAHPLSCVPDAWFLAGSVFAPIVIAPLSNMPGF